MNDLRIADLGGAVHWKRDEDLEDTPENEYDTEEKRRAAAERLFARYTQPRPTKLPQPIWEVAQEEEATNDPTP